MDVDVAVEHLKLFAEDCVADLERLAAFGADESELLPDPATKTVKVFVDEWEYETMTHDEFFAREKARKAS